MMFNFYGYQCFFMLMVISSYLRSSCYDSKLCILASIILGHPVLSLVHVPLLIGDSVETVIDIVARARQVLAELSRAAEWASLLKHMSRLSHLAIASFVKYLAVISDDLCIIVVTLNIL